jgi:hypothetical protein
MMIIYLLESFLKGNRKIYFFMTRFERFKRCNLNKRYPNKLLLCSMELLGN